MFSAKNLWLFITISAVLTALFAVVAEIDHRGLVSALEWSMALFMGLFLVFTGGAIVGAICVWLFHRLRMEDQENSHAR